MTGEGDESSEVRQVAARAVRRLDILEQVILAVAAGLAVLAGALTAMLLRVAFELPFRPTWIVASLVLFIGPAVGSYVRARRQERAAAESASRTDTHPLTGERDDVDGR